MESLEDELNGKTQEVVGCRGLHIQTLQLEARINELGGTSENQGPEVTEVL